ncbi:MAG: hypothetical protein H7Z14_00205 [Anaerolineae bacterium]|nr:hypothetical protein [Phycisphaerae bacterium]
MRTIVIIPVLIAICAAGGYAVALAMSKTPPVREIVAAALVCLIASELAFVPIMLTRGASQASISQAALVSTMIHLFACCGLGGGLIVTKAFSLGPAFAYWLLGLYWLTLIVLVIGLVGAVKAAPVGDAAKV